MKRVIPKELKGYFKELKRNGYTITNCSYKRVNNPFTKEVYSGYSVHSERTSPKLEMLIEHIDTFIREEK